jgi:uncharacterized protein (TIGR02271 family)
LLSLVTICFQLLYSVTIESVKVTKEPYVKEEVSVKKKPVTETRQVTDEVRSERVNVQGASKN